MAATITGTLQNPFSESYVGAVRFTSSSTPEVVSGVVIVGRSKTISTDTAGAFSVVLQPGVYTVSANGDEFIITVPITSGTYTIQELITSGATIVKILGLDFSAAKNSQYLGAIPF